jgi:glycosidase
MLKRLFVILILALQVTSLGAQMVYTDPAIPVNGKPLKIYFNTSLVESDASFKNYTGDVYAHTGVTTRLGDWKYVIGTAWADNATEPKMTSLGSNLYRLDIATDIRTFYKIAATDTASRICIVFRSSDATKQTRPDIFINVYTLSLNTSFILPEKNSLIVNLNATIPVKAAASNADSVSLFINNKWIKKGKTNDLVTDTLIASQYGEFWVKSVAWSLPSFAADSFFFYVRKPVVTEALPAGLKDGINYTSSTSATLVLHAPYKNYVFATGDFTNWTACEKGYMKRTPDGERYWLELTGLTSGKEYRFQYIVDSSLYIADPYADKILDPWNDSYITSVTYPGLIAYPQDKTTEIVSVLQTSQVPYSWKTTGYTPPAKSKLVIYELLIRDFLANHDFKTLIDTLSYLNNLGVNAIELMPVCEFEGNLSWGYNPSFYFAPDKYYGPKNDMKAFVDSCHARGIAVIMDMVLNHCFGQSPFVRLYLDYYGTDQIFMKLPNPWFNASSPNPVYKWGADFNHESASTQELVDRINAYWLTEYNVDGFRFDFTKGFTNTPGDGSAYDASRIAILKRMADKIWNVKPSAYVILEHFTADAEEQELANYGMMVWGNNNYNYSEAAMGYTSDLTAVSWLGRGWSVPGIVSYMESHDEERLMYKTITFGSSTGDYNTRNQKIALKRMALDALFFLTIPGPKMIWQFGELGYDVSIDEGGRVSNKPIKWEYFSDTDRHSLFLFYRLLNNFRKNLPVFSTTNYSWSLSSPAKRLQLNGSGTSVNILGNFGVTETTIIPAFQQTGKWFEYFTEDSINVTNVNANITLQPGEFRLYSTQKLGSPKLTLAIEDHYLPTYEEFVTAYPNPSSGTISFEINNVIPVPVTLTVFDISGRVIRQIRTGNIPDGRQIVTWDGKTENGSDAGSGIYLVSVRTPMRMQTIKVIRK